MNNRISILRKSKSQHATIRKTPYQDKHQYNQRLQQENLQKSQIQQHQTQKLAQAGGKRKYIYVLANIKLDKIQTNYLVSEQLPIFRKTVSLKCPQEEGMGDFKNHAFVTAPKQ